MLLFFSHRYLFLFAIFSTICFSACTFDYFEDETNYVVYVPKADKNLRSDTYKIDQLDILIYNQQLSKETSSEYPFSENARSRIGNFNFRLYPASYDVFCFTNSDSVDFYDIDDISTSRFDLQKCIDETYYQEPPEIYMDHDTPTIQFPGPVVYDTARFERLYVGRICVAFKNLSKVDSSLTYSNIKKVEVIASGIGVTQYLSAMSDSVNTRSARFNADDEMKMTAEPFSVQYKDFEFGIQNYYFPSPDLSGEGRESEPIRLRLQFIGQNDQSLSSLNISVVDTTNSPIVLHTNETLVVEVDGNNIQILRLAEPEDWNPVIESEEESSPGSGGKEI